MISKEQILIWLQNSEQRKDVTIYDSPDSRGYKSEEITFNSETIYNLIDQIYEGIDELNLEILKLKEK